MSKPVSCFYAQGKLPLKKNGERGNSKRTSFLSTLKYFIKLRSNFSNIPNIKTNIGNVWEVAFQVSPAPQPE